MNLINLKKKIFILVGIITLSGCTATYNLDISYNNFSETLNIYSNSIDNSNYFIPAFYNSINEEEYDVDVNQKLDGIEYYNINFTTNESNLSYNFTNNNFSKSNIANSFFSSFIFKKYDFDEDGKEDYYILSTTKDFSGFDLYPVLTEVTIKIKNNYEVISSNADEIVDDNIYIWHLTPNNIKSINMVYNPEVVVDNRNFIQKISTGDYFNIFTFSLLLFIIGFIVYKIIKRKGEKRNQI